jgi:phage-related protein
VTKIPKKISVSFFQSDNGKMPVRDWLLGLSAKDKKNIGEDIKTVELGWPVGMPVAKPLGDKLFEVRSVLINGDQARIIFTIYKSSMILLHGFIKKSKKTPKRDLELAKNRMRKFLQDPKAKT